LYNVCLSRLVDVPQSDDGPESLHPANSSHAASMRQSFLKLWIGYLWTLLACSIAWGVPSSDLRETTRATSRPLGDARDLTGPVLIPAQPDRRVDQPQVAPSPANAPASGVLSPVAITRLEGTINTLERRLFVDAADGQWDEHTLLEAALIASGVQREADLRAYVARVDALAAELQASLSHSGGASRAGAQTVFEFMHARVLRGGYQLDGTDLALVLDQGRFNCVSATVLFNCLASRLGMPAVGVEVPGHARSRLLLPDGPLDVETTCPVWFRVMDDPRKQAEVLEKTLGHQARSDQPAEPRVVSDVELVATIYYNRGVDLLAKKRFAEALAVNARSLRLDPTNTTAQGNLLATLNNWAIDLATQTRYSEAIGLLNEGLSLAPEYEVFRLNHTHISQQWAASQWSPSQGRGQP
jgi:tetratricopeptide (TPR) repeat protein